LPALKAPHQLPAEPEHLPVKPERQLPLVSLLHLQERLLHPLAVKPQRQPRLLLQPNLPVRANPVVAAVEDNLDWLPEW
jgi:hypothetical protein